MSVHSDLKTFHHSTPGQLNSLGGRGSLLELNIKDSTAFLTVKMPVW